MSRKETKYIIIHCTATKPSMDIGLEEVDSWHRARGFLSCGYHKIIRRDGTIEQGRADEEVGAHCRGRNHDSISVSMVGGVSENNIDMFETSVLKDFYAKAAEATSFVQQPEVFDEPYKGMGSENGFVSMFQG